MVFEFNLPHVFTSSSSQHENAAALKAMLNCLIELNSAYLLDHQALPLYQSGVVYGRTQIWETIPALYQRQFGDCKSLSAALIAQYRKAGVRSRPVFRWIRNRFGGTDYHILVQTEKGFEDPSRVLGMGKDENAHMSGGARIARK